MNLHVEHDASALAALLGLGAPACDSIVVRAGAPDQVLACRLDANPLAPDPDARSWAFDPMLPGEILLSWSGSLAQDLTEATPANWGPAGQEALDAFCDRVRPAMEREDRMLCLQPHARHTLSDLPGCRRFLGERTEQPIGLALAPSSMLETSMLETLEDHLERLFEALGPVARLIVLDDVRPADDRLLPTALGEGVLPRDTVRRLLAAHVSDDTPVVVRAGDLAAQREFLGL